MKKVYFIVPLVLTIAFAFYYSGFAEELEQREAERAREVARVEAEAAGRKKEAEIAAKEDADRRSAERQAEEAKRAADREARWQEETQKILDATTKFGAEADKLAKQAADLEIQLLNLRQQREQVGKESFDLEKQVEAARVAKRNAELEIQRTTEMIARRASNSSLTRVAVTTP